MKYKSNLCRSYFVYNAFVRVHVTSSACGDVMRRRQDPSLKPRGNCTCMTLVTRRRSSPRWLAGPRCPCGSGVSLVWIPRGLRPCLVTRCVGTVYPLCPTLMRDPVVSVFAYFCFYLLDPPPSGLHGLGGVVERSPP